jgi:hypothetical protein
VLAPVVTAAGTVVLFFQADRIEALIRLALATAEASP